jgi:hypothetical protein
MLVDFSCFNDLVVGKKVITSQLVCKVKTIESLHQLFSYQKLTIFYQKVEIFLQHYTI